MSGTTYPRLKRLSLVNRLKLTDLPQPLRYYATGLVVVALIASLVILLTGLRLYPIESPLVFPDPLNPPQNLAVPFSLILLLLLGFGFVAGALIYGSYQPGWTTPFATRFIIGLLSAALPLYFLRFAGMGNILNARELSQFPLILQSIFLFLAFGCGIAAIICSFLSSPRIAQWAAWFGMGAFVGTAFSFLLWKIWWDFTVRNSLQAPDSMHPILYLNNLFTSLIFMLGIILFWQVITEVKIFSREVGLRVANLSNRLSWLLAALFAFKMVWLAVGLWGAYRGEAGDIWQTSLQDGKTAWVLAAVYAIGAGWLLLHISKPLGSAQLNRSAGFLTAGFLFVFVLTFLIYFLGQLLLNVEDSPTQDYQPLSQCFTMGQGSLGGFFACLINGLVEFFESWMILFVASLIPLGLIFLRSRRLRGLAPVCILAGVWALPTLIGVISFMLGREDINPSFEYLSFDVVLTLVLLYFAVLAWRGKAPATNLWMITLILVVSTLTALAETLIPPAWADFSFALFLIVPILYQLFFDSVELNTEGPTRGQRILRTLGWQAGLMVVVAWAVTLGRLAPGVEGLEHVGAKIFLPVLLGLYLVNMNSERESSQLRMN